MPFVLPPSLIETDEIALVLAFGKASLLEACASFEGSVRRAESPCERIAVLTIERPSLDKLASLAGSHKAAPVTVKAGSTSDDLGKLTAIISDLLEDKSNISLSGYEVDEEAYDDLVRSILDGVRDAGLRKVRLLRPKGRELMAEQVLSREALDVVAFPYHGGFGLGPTVWVPDSGSLRNRGTRRPVPHSDISLSPRLARVLLNIAGLKHSQTVLDPFCGSGTILMEAQTMSIRCLGLDSRASRVEETRENLRWSADGAVTMGYDIRKGDARELTRMLRGTKVDAIVTEPVLLPRIDARPKTATASALIDQAGEVYTEALASMADSILPGGRIVIVAPVILTMEGDEVALNLEGRKLGLRNFQPGPVGFDYPVRLSFESTRWVRRAVYAFESPS
jgi:precorrin-6B methylase 2